MENTEWQKFNNFSSNLINNIVIYTNITKQFNLIIKNNVFITYKLYNDTFILFRKNKNYIILYIQIILNFYNFLL